MPFGLFKTIKSAKSGGTIGIDIGTSSIKVVELEKKSGWFYLMNYGIYELKGVDNIVINEESEKWQNILKLPDIEIAQGIREIIANAGIRSTDAVASIPSFSTFSTVIELPYISNEDLAKAIPFEAKKYIPIAIDEVVLDWSIVGVIQDDDGKGSHPASVEIFLAAVPKEEVRRYQDIAKSAGLNLRALELENAAVIRGLLGNDPNPSMIVNIGGRSTSMVIVDKGYERLSHNYEIGGFEITKSISQSLNISLEKSEELKRRFGLRKSDDNVINESMTSLIDMIVLETQKVLINYEDNKKETIQNVVVIGGLTNMPDFVDYFKTKLGRDVVLGNPFSKIVYPDSMEPLIGELSSIFSVAMGLAMREEE